MNFKEFWKKEVTLKHKGFVFGGKAWLTLWGGGTGTIEMTEWTSNSTTLNQSDILRGINDGQFGCQSIDKAEVEVYELYENGYREHLKTVTIKNTSGHQMPDGRGTKIPQGNRGIRGIN
jgi:hypothetical protein